MKKLIKRNKRILIVNRDFQLRYTKAAVVVALSSTLITVFLILFPLYYLEVIRFPDFLPNFFLIGIALASAANFVFIGLFTVHLTHRIAGPIFSLVRRMRLIQSGQWNARLQVRSNDDVKYLIRNFNELVDYLVLTSTRDLEQVELIVKKLQEDNSVSAKADLEEFAGIIRARSNLN